MKFAREKTHCTNINHIVIQAACLHWAYSAWLPFSMSQTTQCYTWKKTQWTRINTDPRSDSAPIIFLPESNTNKYLKVT